eukprot:TRINITY_DN6610_c0_g1_i2.p1 TRINITY_DN6610_c0_g1~~TRINITY_DN6610_c0_g1_i2.p1  ORF type:complete len:1837 (+),score=304.29 TRINITY_DN6610_c0_g1_i2:65-5575(+)
MVHFAHSFFFVFFAISLSSLAASAQQSGSSSLKDASSDRTRLKDIYWGDALQDIEVQGVFDDVSSPSAQIHRDLHTFLKELKADPSLKNKDSSILRAMPSKLDFGERPIFVPVSESIEIVNLSNDNVIIHQVFFDSTHFSSTFQEKILYAQGHVIIPVSHLPQVLGRTECMAVIRSSVGWLVVQIHSFGIPNPYRVSPLLNLNVILGSKFSTYLSLHNPYDTELQVRDIASQDQFVQLSPIQHGSFKNVETKTWTIAPHSTKYVIQVDINPSHLGKHLAHINIITNRHKMSVPVEFMVTRGSLSRRPEEVSFEAITSPDTKTTESIYLKNTGSKPIQIKEIFLSPPSGNVFLQSSSILTLAPGEPEMEVAQLTLNGKSEGEFSGRIIIKTNDTSLPKSKVEIPYRGRVVHGKLDVLLASPIVDFRDLSSPTVRRSFSLTHTFKSPLLLHAIHPNNASVVIHGFSEDIVLLPGDKFDGLELQFPSRSMPTALPISLSIDTNVTTFDILVLFHPGTLEISSLLDTTASHSRIVDFGLVPLKGLSEHVIRIFNPSPVPITLLNVRSPSSSMKLRHKLPQENPELISRDEDGKIQYLQILEGITVMPGRSEFVEIVITASKEEPSSHRLHYSTKHENSTLIVKFTGVMMDIEPHPRVIRFESSFPGRTLRVPMELTNHLQYPVSITSTVSSDPRIICVMTTDMLEPSSKTVIGYVKFDPSRSVLDKNYMIEPSFTAQNSLSKAGEPLTKRDYQALKRREKVWDSLQVSGETLVVANLTYHTDKNINLRLVVQASLTKPSIIHGLLDNFNFGLVQIGSAKEIYIPVSNPSDVPVHVQLLPFSPNSTGTNQTFPIYYSPSTPDVFQMSPKASQGVVIPPHENVTMGPIFFKPFDNQTHHAMIYLKNNLTILEIVELRGQGGEGVLEFQLDDEIIRDGSLRFDFSEEFLTSEHGCGNVIIEEKSILVKNTGTLPLFNLTTWIDGIGCWAYGFEVVNCTELSLLPGDSASITLAFSPDFHSSYVEKQLTVRSFQTKDIATLSIVSTIPYELLPHCSDSIPPSPLSEAFRRFFVAVCFSVFFWLLRMSVKENPWVYHDSVIGEFSYPYHLTSTNSYKTTRKSTAAENVVSSSPLSDDEMIDLEQPAPESVPKEATVSKQAQKGSRPSSPPNDLNRNPQPATPSPSSTQASTPASSNVSTPQTQKKQNDHAQAENSRGNTGSKSSSELQTSEPARPTVSFAPIRKKASNIQTKPSTQTLPPSDLQPEKSALKDSSKTDAERKSKVERSDKVDKGEKAEKQEKTDVHAQQSSAAQQVTGKKTSVDTSSSSSSSSTPSAPKVSSKKASKQEKGDKGAHTKSEETATDNETRPTPGQTLFAPANHTQISAKPANAVTKETHVSTPIRSSETSPPSSRQNAAQTGASHSAATSLPTKTDKKQASSDSKPDLKNDSPAPASDSKKKPASAPTEPVATNLKDAIESKPTVIEGPPATKKLQPAKTAAKTTPVVPVTSTTKQSTQPISESHPSSSSGSVPSVGADAPITSTVVVVAAQSKPTLSTAPAPLNTATPHSASGHVATSPSSRSQSGPTSPTTKVDHLSSQAEPRERKEHSEPSPVKPSSSALPKTVEDNGPTAIVAPTAASAEVPSNVLEQHNIGDDHTAVEMVVSSQSGHPISVSVKTSSHSQPTPNVQTHPPKTSNSEITVSKKESKASKKQSQTQSQHSHDVVSQSSSPSTQHSNSNTAAVDQSTIVSHSSIASPGQESKHATEASHATSDNRRGSISSDTKPGKTTHGSTAVVIPLGTEVDTHKSLDKGNSSLFLTLYHVFFFSQPTIYNTLRSSITCKRFS